MGSTPRRLTMNLNYHNTKKFTPSKINAGLVINTIGMVLINRLIPYFAKQKGKCGFRGVMILLLTL